jgi:hypothetical protein
LVNKNWVEHPRFTDDFLIHFSGCVLWCWNTAPIFLFFLGDDSHPSHRTISSLVSQISGWVFPQYWDGPMTSICFGMDWTHQAVLNLLYLAMSQHFLVVWCASRHSEWYLE